MGMRNIKIVGATMIKLSGSWNWDSIRVLLDRYGLHYTDNDNEIMYTTGKPEELMLFLGELTRVINFSF